MRCALQAILPSARGRSIDEWRARHTLRRPSRLCLMASRQFQLISCRLLVVGIRHLSRNCIEGRASLLGLFNGSCSCGLASCFSVGAGEVAQSIPRIALSNLGHPMTKNGSGRGKMKSMPVKMAVI